MKDVATEHALMDVLCPMHLQIGETGHVLHAGPMLGKLFPDLPLKGVRFLELFELKRPHRVRNVADLRATAGTKLHLKMRQAPFTEVKGVAAQSLESGYLVVNLSFGISIVDAVRDFRLTSADFAVTDLTIEMLYLIEAKSAAMDALKSLNGQLQVSMVAAEEQAFTDTLTGLKNRRAMEHVMARHIEWDRPFAVMQIDLDFFKTVNDTMGHAAGDHVLQNVARVMLDVTRSDDVVARVGGDEFVVMLPGVGTREVLDGIGMRLIERLEEPIPFAGQACHISGSIGTTFFEKGSGVDMGALMDDVDVALYASKNAGRGRLTFYRPELRQRGQPAA